MLPGFLPRFSLLRRSRAVTIIAVALILLSALLLVGGLRTAGGSGAAGEYMQVLVTTADLQPGTVITAKMLRTMKVPRAYMVPGSLHDQGKAVGQRVLRYIARGEPVTGASISGGRGVAARIPAEMRAYSLDLATTRGSGEVQPGDRVDLISTSTAVDPPQGTTLLHERLVLEVFAPSADQLVSYGSTRITLLVTPGEAELLAVAESTGQVTVSLCPVTGGAEADR